MRMIVARPIAVVAAFSNSRSPTSFGESVCAAMPDPITRAARNTEPKSSASRRRASGGSAMLEMYYIDRRECY
jgi:hypothetical protein